MVFDKKVPLQLKKTQRWFGSIIGQPIDEDNLMQPITPSGKPIGEEAPYFIAPSPTLKPEQRIQIYNQQYWWRLFSALQENFPLVFRLFGHHDFNYRLVTPYLLKYPPHHWSLSYLGDQFPNWIAEEYTASDKQLIYDAACIDLAFIHGFIAPEGDPLPKIDSERLSAIKMTLQQHVNLFELPYDLFFFRARFLEKDAEYWIDNDFPPLEHAEDIFCFILYRNSQNQMSVEKISKSEYQLLKRFQNTSSIDDLCSFLEELSPQDPLSIEASEHLSLWCQRWLAHNWLREMKNEE